MNRQPAVLFACDFFEPLPNQIEVSDAPLTSDVVHRRLAQLSCVFDSWWYVQLGKEQIKLAQEKDNEDAACRSRSAQTKGRPASS